MSPSVVRSLSVVASSVSLLLLVACHREGERPETPSKATVTGAELGSSSNDDAVMRVATARCERELACNKIGQGRAYEDQPTCLSQMGELMDEEAGRETCPRGVERYELTRCLFDIQQTPCGGALERATNIPGCTKATLCAR